MPLIYLIILNWNGKKDTLECLSSVQKIDYPHHKVVVVDNGSSDDSALAIRREFPQVTLLETKKNLGYAGGNNVGIRFALEQGADAVFLLNNDTVVDPGILKAFAKGPCPGIFGAKIYLYADRSRLDHLGGVWNRKRGDFDLIGNRSLDEGLGNEKVDYACGAALFIKKEVFESIGLLEPNFFLFWEEADFCFRARRAGFDVAVCREAKVWHKVSASFVGGKPHTTYFWWRSRLLWIERNCTPKEKASIYARVIVPEVLKLLKLRTLKTLQLHLFCPKQEKAQRLEKILKYKAGLRGVRDYVLRRFGNWETT